MQFMMMLPLVLVVLPLAGAGPAAAGGRVVRAALQLRNAAEAVVEPTLRKRLLGDATRLVTELRAAPRLGRRPRRFAYAAATERLRALEVAAMASESGAGRVRVLMAARNLAEALADAVTACQRDTDCGHDQFCERPTGACDGPGPLGYCAPRRSECTCLAQVAPVCGCDGQVYLNRCRRLCAAVRQASRDVCRSAP
jgi:hypothetical protein